MEGDFLSFCFELSIRIDSLWLWEVSKHLKLITKFADFCSAQQVFTSPMYLSIKLVRWLHLFDNDPAIFECVSFSIVSHLETKSKVDSRAESITKRKSSESINFTIQLLKVLSYKRTLAWTGRWISPFQTMTGDIVVFDKRNVGDLFPWSSTDIMEMNWSLVNLWNFFRFVGLRNGVYTCDMTPLNF